MRPAPAPLVWAALFPGPVPAALAGGPGVPPGGRPCSAAEVTGWLTPPAGWACSLADDERSAASAAGSGLAWPRDPAASAGPPWRSAVATIRRCHALGAVATVLPGARKVVGAAALAVLLTRLTDDSACLALFVQIELTPQGRWLRARTCGMTGLGLPELACRVPLAQRERALSLLQGGMAHLAALGAHALAPGSLVEASAPDGTWRLRFRVLPAAAEGADAATAGALQLLPIPDPPPGAASAPTPGDGAVAARLLPFVEQGRRASGLDLQGASLAAMDLAGLGADRIDLSGADLAGALLRGSRLGHCRLAGARLTAIDAGSVTWRSCVLDAALADGACFEGARIEDCSATGADFSGADLRGAGLSETSFDRALLRDALLDRASGDGVVFRGADLSWASLVGARFEDADFRGADLRGADLSDGSFRHADFRGALLDGARLDGADFTGAWRDAQAPAPPAGAARADASPTAGATPGLDDLLADVLGQLRGGAVSPSPLLAELLARAGVVPQPALAEPAQRLRELLQQLQSLPDGVETPEAMLLRCQRRLEQAVPPLAQVLGAQDWQALAGVLQRLQAEAAAAAGGAAPAPPVAP